MIFSRFRHLFKRKLKIGNRIAVTLYRGTCYEDAERMRKYLQVHQDGDELLLVEDAKGNDVYVKVDKVVFDELRDSNNNVKYTVMLKGEITND